MMEPEIFDEVIAKIDTMDNDELNSVIQAVKDRRGVLARRLGAQFKKGDEVKFTDSCGKEIIGIVEKVNRKSVSIHEKDNPIAGWRIYPSLLKKVE